MKKSFLVLLFMAQFILPMDAANAACSSTPTSGGMKVGSTISGGSVVLCASTSGTKTSVTTKTTSTVRKVAAPIAKVAPTPKPCVIQVPAAALVYGMSVAGCSVVVAPPVKSVVAKPKLNTTTTANAAVTSQSDQAAFTPNPIGISSSASSGSVGQAFLFGAIAGAHSRTGTILGQPAQVNFAPVNFDWSSDDGDSGSGNSFSTSWISEGAHSVGLTVDYAVSYSVGSGWVDAGIISSSASASVSVAAAPVAISVKAAPPLLVSGNCLIRPGSYRC